MLANEYIDEELAIPEPEYDRALSDYYNHGKGVLYLAGQDCVHDVREQASGGVRCIKCGGWYCS